MMGYPRRHVVAVLALCACARGFAPAPRARAPWTARASSPEPTEAAAKKEPAAKAPDGGSSGHVVAGMPELTPEQAAVQERVQAHQQGAEKLGAAEEIRTMIHNSHGFAVLSTNSQSLDGYPSGSVVGFASDATGRPFFVFSGMSGHTQDLVKDTRASLTVASASFKGAADGRVSLVGDVVRVPRDEVDALKGAYREKHPGAFWVDFKDFTWWRMDEIKAIRFVGGFARAGAIQADEYHAAAPDPISAFAAPVMNHMNDDHSDATLAMVKHYIGFPATAASIVGLDRLGMYIKCDGGQMGAAKLRLPFPRPATDRASIKGLIVEMTKASAASAE